MPAATTVIRGADSGTSSSPATSNARRIVAPTSASTPPETRPLVALAGNDAATSGTSPSDVTIPSILTSATRQTPPSPGTVTQDPGAIAIAAKPAATVRRTRPASARASIVSATVFAAPASSTAGTSIDRSRTPAPGRRARCKPAW